MRSNNADLLRTLLCNDAALMFRLLASRGTVRFSSPSLVTKAMRAWQSTSLFNRILLTGPGPPFN